MKEYNGHRSWNAWNVSLWINNDEALYRQAEGLCNMYARSAPDEETARHAAADMFLHNVVGKGAKTPDGAVYNKLSIFHAMEGMV